MILFGYRCGVQVNTKFSLHMLLTNHTPRLKVDNFLSMLVQTFDTYADLAFMAEQMISKLQLITKMHGEVTNNIC
jgi:predicted ester cyclase